MKLAYWLYYMKVNKANIIVGLVVMLVIFCMMWYFHGVISDYKRQVRDLSVRLAQADERVDTFFIRDSIPVTRVEVVEVDRTDYKEKLADKQLIKDLKLRVSELESVSEQVVSVRDTTYLSGNVDSDSILSYSDKWSTFVFHRTRGILDWEVRDSLSTYVSTEYRHHFLWWRWGRKGYQVAIVNHNPRARVKYEKYIKIK